MFECLSISKVTVNRDQKVNIKMRLQTCYVRNDLLACFTIVNYLELKLYMQLLLIFHVFAILLVARRVAGTI